MREALLDLLLPETDRGATTQWLVAGVVWMAIFVSTREWRREYRLFLVGLAMVNLAWFAARTVH